MQARLSPRSDNHVQFWNLDNAWLAVVQRGCVVQLQDPERKRMWVPACGEDRADELNRAGADVFTNLPAFAAAWIDTRDTCKGFRLLPKFVKNDF